MLLPKRDRQIISKDRVFSELIKKEAKREDTESSHGVMDELLCELLSDLGFVRTVKEFRAAKKWYA